MPPKKKEDGTVSAFERRRLENIAANNALLRDLSETAAKILPTPKAEPAKRKRASAAAPAKRTRTLRETVQPTRRSSRVAGLDADSETLNRKLEVEAEASGEAARLKRARVSGDLQLGDIKVEGRKWEGGVDGMANLKGLGLGIPARGAQPGVRTFKQEDIEETSNKDLKDLRLRMSGLKLYEKWAVNGRSSRDCCFCTFADRKQISSLSLRESTQWASIQQKRSPLYLPATRRARWVCSMRHKNPRLTKTRMN